VSKIHNGKEYINLAELAEKLMAADLVLSNTSQKGPLTPIELDGEAHWDLEEAQKRLAELNLPFFGSK
jgi:hypothetical protein